MEQPAPSGSVLRRGVRAACAPGIGTRLVSFVERRTQEGARSSLAIVQIFNGLRNLAKVTPSNIYYGSKEGRRQVWTRGKTHFPNHGSTALPNREAATIWSVGGLIFSAARFVLVND
jgi:hypothetical protein